MCKKYSEFIKDNYEESGIAIPSKLLLNYILIIIVIIIIIIILDHYFVMGQCI